MASPETSYRSLSDGNPFRNDCAEPANTNDHEDTPQNSGVMIHIVPETSKARWNHIKDLDSFFTRMYTYHQKHGFTVIVLDEAFQLCEFGFVIWLFTFTIHCVNHSVLFGNTPPNGNHTKVTLSDVIKPMGECVESFGGLTYITLLLAALYFMFRLIKMISNMTHFLDIKKFYNAALHIDDNELDNITWHDVKKKIREVQAEQQMCIDKTQLTDLDIYHRILRFQNYMVALMNKNLLPVRFSVPIYGDVVGVSRGLLFNIDLILFRNPGSPFQNNWKLRDDYTVRSNQIELAQRLSKLITWVAIGNLVLSPLIFLWQLIYFSFAYANVLRKEPSALGTRTWSNYGRLYLRHFNELEHELDARLNRAYVYGDRYLSSFSSPLTTVIAKNMLFISGGMLVLILALGIYEEYVFQVEHVLTIITVLSAIGLICRSLIPDENLIWCPEQFMTAILAHAHYLPTEWKNKAHTTLVRNEFGNFFQFKAGYLLYEICSPLMTPFILLFVFRPKALEIVKFFSSFTVTVSGVGNVCSFAQMDVRKHGNPEWQIQSNIAKVASENTDDDNKKPFQTENGKIELSLVRFTLTNPEWQMSPDAHTFIKGIRENALKDLVKAKRTPSNPAPNPLTESLISFGTIGDEYSSIATSVFNAHNIPNAPLTKSLQQSVRHKGRDAVAVAPEFGRLNEASDFEQMLLQNLSDPSGHLITEDDVPRSSKNINTSAAATESMRKMRVSKIEGCLEGPSDGLLYNIYGIDPRLTQTPTDITVAEMCLSTLYLHELHKQNMVSPSTNKETDSRKRTIITSKAAENTPLLGNIRS